MGALAAGICTTLAAHDAVLPASLLEARTHRQQLQLPPVGLGLWKSAPGDVHAAVKQALLCGCRLLDGAAGYGNEAEVGGALAEAISERIVRREDVWVVSKLFNTHHCWESDTARPAEALDKTLKDLGVAYLDVWLMHWPVAIEQKDLKPLGGLRLPDGVRLCKDAQPEPLPIFYAKR